jgi:succinate-semialdehyde dehydrogenase/glutarate-semialdehyde dehydrogenase
VKQSVALGAKLVVGGRRIDGPGFYYAPTLLAEVPPKAPAFLEETFGPVAALALVDDEEQALALANATPYGLGANLWTRDLARAKRLAQRFEAGSVFINGMVASDPRLPFGGVKRSGYGRELSAFGMREFTNVQTVWIGPAKGEAPRAE